jgi:hypothetical protein
MNVTNIDTRPCPDKHQKFAARCEARAALWQLGEYGGDARALHRAADPLLAIARQLGIKDANEIQLAMARAFSRVRDDLGGWVVP